MGYLKGSPWNCRSHNRLLAGSKEMVRKSPYPIEDIAGPAEQLIMEGGYLAVVTVQWEADHGWGPTISAADAFKLDRVREALKRGDLATAKLEAQVYRLTPVAGVGMVEAAE
jgi:hypothetical protein